MWAEASRPRPAALLAAAACALLAEERAWASAPAPAPSADQPAAAASLDEAVVSYPPGFFRDFRPATALDMIGRIPGFAYNRGNAGVRGLAGASGNVLIDGQRPSTKSLGLDDVIRRIPASAVLRIDVIRGGGGAGVDMLGHSMVANIVRDPSGATLFTGELLTKVYTDHAPARGLRLEALRASGDLNLEGAINWRDERDQGVSGRGRLVRRDGAGRVRESGAFEADWDRAVLQANGAADYRFGDNFLRLSLGGERDRQERDEVADLGAPDGGSARESLFTDFSSDQGELSLDYERSLGASADLSLLLLESRELDRLAATASAPSGRQRSTQRELAGESILRGALSYAPSPDLTIDGGVERAFNFLDARSSFVRDGAPVELPSADVRVEERRIESSGTLRWRAWSGGTISAGIAYEQSRLSQDGDVSRSKSLALLKPRFAATLDPAAGWQVRLRVERIAGQLNFQDFASRASLDTDSVSAGNPDLEPETQWVVEAAFERRFWERGAATVTLSHARISDAIDLIPIDGGYDAPGNIGDGVRTELALALAIPFDPLGVSGTLVRFNGRWRSSEVVDPVTELERRISRERPFTGELFVTKDLPRLESIVGADLFFGFEERSYQLREVRIERATGDPLARLYWDWTPQTGTSLRLQLEGWTFRERSRRRILYEGTRAGGVVAQSESRFATLDPFLMVRLRKTL